MADVPANSVDKVLVVTFILIILLLMASIGVYHSRKETLVSLGIVLDSIVLLIALIGLQVKYWNHPNAPNDPPINWSQFLFGMVCLLYIAIFMFLTSKN